jgi:hypothetical protein
MDPVTIIGLAALGGAAASDANKPRKPKIHAAILPMVIRHLGYHWRHFHLTPCGGCRAPSWQQPCPWCSYYPQGRYTAPTSTTFTRESWHPYRPSKKGLERRQRAIDEGRIEPNPDFELPWLVQALLRDANKMVGKPYEDMDFIRKAAHWFEWPTQEEVWDIWTMRDRPPSLWNMIPSERELGDIGDPFGQRPIQEGARAGYREKVRLTGPLDLAKIRARWTPEFEAEWEAWVSREPQRRARRLIGHR